jgi:RHS repeat-associated protein
MLRWPWVYAVFLVVFLTVCVSVTSAQTGFPPFGSFENGSFDTTNRQNLNTNFAIPITGSPGRGISLSLALVNDSMMWVGGTGFTSWTPLLDLNGNPTWGWKMTSPFGNIKRKYYSTICRDGGISYPYYHWDNYVYTDGVGTAHSFTVNVNDSTACTGGTISGIYTGYAADHSGYYIDITPDSQDNPTLYSPSGVKMGGLGDINQITDTNGNFVTRSVAGNVTTWTDTLKRAAVTITDNRSTNQTMLYQYLAENGTALTVQVNYTAYNIKTNFQCSGLAEYSSSGTVLLPTQAIFLPGDPHQMTYSISYEDTPGFSGFKTGRVSQVSLPTGGSYQYQYYASPANPSVDHGGVNCADGSYTYLTKTISDGTNSNAWAFTRNLTTGATTETPPSVAPDSGAHAVYTFSGSAPASAVFYSAATEDAAHTMRTINTTWAANGTPATQVTILDDNKQSQVSTTFDSNGILQSRSEYDYGSGGVGPLIRTTSLTYLNSSAYLAMNLIHLVTRQTVTDGSGATIARTDYAYDCYTSPCATLASSGYTGVTQHDDANYGSANTVRGNLTQVTTYTNAAAGSGALIENLAYNILGNIVSSTDPKGNPTTFSYADSWGNAACAPTGGAQAYLTGATNALGQSASSKFNSCTGTLASITDANSNPTSFTYDSYGRALTSSSPDGGSASVSYTDGANPVISATQAIDAAKSLSTSTTMDGLGRVSRTSVDSAPGGPDVVDITYDARGRKLTESNPHSSTAASTDGVTTYQYDALGRATQVTKQDGSVSTISYNGSCFTSSDEAGKQRKLCADGLGRLIAVDEPGDSYAGTSASGSISINGSLQSITTSGHSATKATGSVTISGTEQRQPVDPSCTIRCQFIYDTGTVTITVNGFSKSVSFGQGSSALQIATNLTNAFNSDPASPVSASTTTVTSTSYTVNLTSYAASSAANYALSSSYTYDSGDFAHSSFTTSNSGSTLTGGTDAVNPTTTYDAGTVTLSLPGYSAQANYGNGSGQDGTAAAVALDLYNQIKAQLPASSPPFSISLPSGGTTISFNWNSVGAAGNVTVSSIATTTQTASFSVPSFAACTPITTNPQNCSTALSNGTDAYASGLAHPYVTLYSYDGLGNLTCAVQKGMDTSAFTTCAAAPTAWRPRSFTYDSLSRLLTASNPESGAVSYQYDGNGNITAKTDARGITINYNPSDSPIDSLNRVTKKTYSNGDPPVTFVYDVPPGNAPGTLRNPVGRLLSASTGSASNMLSYDAMGRVASEWQCTPLNCGSSWFRQDYGYNLAGELISHGFDNGFTIAQAYDSGGRLAQVTSTVSDAQHPATLASVDPNIGFYPSGVLRKMTLGNGLTETLAYNNRLQPCRTNLNSSSSALSQCSDAVPSGNVQDFAYGFGAAAADNGSLASFSATGSQTFNRAYSYDSLNRLSSMSAPGDACSGLSWTYDAWGNRTDQTVTGGSCNSFHQPVNTNNQLSAGGYQYDAAGNMTNDGTHAYTYDAEGRVSKVDGGSTASYLYDAAGRRIQKVMPSGQTNYFLDLDGNTAVEKDQNGAWVADYIYGNGSLLALYQNSTTSFIAGDHLGSTRLLTAVSQAVSDSMDYLPYGEQIAGGNGTTRKFTGDEHDGESNLEHTWFRKYSSAQGRWTTPDPYLGSMDPSSP